MKYKHKAVNHDSLVLMLDTALAYVFLLMFWRPHLLSANYADVYVVGILTCFSADNAYAHASTYALVKNSLKTLKPYLY